MESIRVIIPAGGSSQRMEGTNKLLAMIGGLPVIIRTLKAFTKLSYINEIILVVPENESEKYRHLINSYDPGDKVRIAFSGATRRISVYNGLMAMSGDDGIVLIHDGARPLVSRKIIDDCIEAALRYGLCIAASKCIDTLKVADNIMFVERTLDREKIYNTQTPQAFKAEFILELHKKAKEDDLDVTDDSMIAEYYGHNVKIVESDPSNIKITTKKDLAIAEALLDYCE